MDSVLLRLPSGELWRCDSDGIRRAYWEDGTFYVRADWFPGCIAFHGEDAEEVSKYLAKLGTDITGQRKATEKVMEYLQRERVFANQQRDMYCRQLVEIGEYLTKQGIPLHNDGRPLTVLERIKALHRELEQPSCCEENKRLRERLKESHDERLALAKQVGRVHKYLDEQGIPRHDVAFDGYSLTVLQRVYRLAEHSWGRKEEDDKLAKAFRLFQRWARGRTATCLVLFSDSSGHISSQGDRLFIFHCFDQLIQQLEAAQPCKE